MKVLLCHSYYQLRGGEDCVFEEERDLLLQGGHEVIEYHRQNEELASKSKLSMARQTLWNRQTAADVRQLIVDHRPDVFHATNTFPLISPSVLREAHRHGVAVVQALQNYRLICPGSYLMREGKPCHDCVGKAVPWPAVMHRCYRDSALASGVVASMVTLHRMLGTWRNKVDLYNTPTEFARQQFLAAGFPAEQVVVKYNMVSPTPPIGHGSGDYFVFVGRLSPEKGIATLLETWKQNATLPCLKIIGDGPLADDVRKAAACDSRIHCLGHLDLPEVHQIVGDARALIMPSIWYETFGRTTVEAFASGTPVIASNLGAMQELVVENRTGLLFEPGNAADLGKRINEFLLLDLETHARLRQESRQRFEGSFTGEQNVNRLLEIYHQACDLAAKRRDRSSKRTLTSSSTIHQEAGSLT